MTCTFGKVWSAHFDGEGKPLKGWQGTLLQAVNSLSPLEGHRFFRQFWFEFSAAIFWGFAILREMQTSSTLLRHVMGQEREWRTQGMACCSVEQLKSQLRRWNSSGVETKGRQ